MKSLKRRPKKRIQSVLESKEPQKRAAADYRQFVQRHYDGLPGELLSLTGLVTGHEALAGHLIKPTGFDVRGCKRILDAACGNGRHARFLLREADDDAMITAFDYSQQMLHRARARLGSGRVSMIAADLTRMPYADASFDAVICGWVLEHLPDPKPGLKELARILSAGGKLLLMTTEDTVNGSVCSRFWHCRTYNRAMLRQDCSDAGLEWHREHWFSPLHRFLHLGGIVVELHRRPQALKTGAHTANEHL
jgi:ubiquinone/menaquinone biosynthesis C-methylase UbiE